MKIVAVLFIFTVQKYMYHSVIIGMKILKVQVNAPLPKRGGSQLEYPVKNPTASPKIGTT